MMNRLRRSTTLCALTLLGSGLTTLLIETAPKLRM